MTTFTPHKAMRKKRILLVDDEKSLTRLVKLSLENNGPYEVKVENQGARAVKIARNFRPDLVLLDVCLVDTDGGQVAREILSDMELKHTPIIFMTALVSREDIWEKPVLTGGIPVLGKPFDAAKLIACIERRLADPSAGATSGKGTSDTRLIRKNLLEGKFAFRPMASPSEN